MSYVLITPIKDEAKNLQQLKNTILNQTVRPIVWIIADSGSKDRNLQIAKKLFEGYDWIHVIQQKQFFEKGYSHKNFAEAINEGYSYAKKLCSENGINYSFVGKTDATPILAKNYFETLLTEMKKDPRIAITCGSQKLHYKDKKIDVKPLRGIPLTAFNDIRLYRKEFFEEMGGYPLAPSPDGILLIKAKNRGWKVKIIPETYFVKPRLGGSKIGIWKGNKSKGKTMYVLGYNLLLMLFNALYLSFKFPPHYQALPIIWGYLLSAIRREEKIEDEEILEYYGKKRLKEVIYALLSRGNAYEK